MSELLTPFESLLFSRWLYSDGSPPISSCWFDLGKPAQSDDPPKPDPAELRKSLRIKSGLESPTPITPQDSEAIAHALERR
jgi:hypothetical protein